MELKKIEGLARFKKYDVQVEFKRLKDNKDKTPEYQMLIYFDDELVYATKRGSFTVEKQNYGEKITWKHFMFWKNIERNPRIELYLKWDINAHDRYYRWCKNLKMCGKVQEVAFEEKKRFQREVLNVEHAEMLEEVVEVQSNKKY